MSSPIPRAPGFASVTSVWRVVVTMIVVTLGGASVAVAQEPPASNVVHITVSDSGRTILDGMIPDIAAISGLRAPPVVEHASALSALRAFCQGVGGSSPDIVLTTRRLRLAAASECAKNGVEHMAQVELGRGAVVLAVRKGSLLTKLTARQVYLALARDVPDNDEFRRNTAIRWSDIDPSLPTQDIRFQLPPREDGGRVLFNALILEGGCRDEPLVKLIFTGDQRVARCVTTRVDRVREIPRDQAVRALIEAPEGTVGVLSSLDLAQSDGQLVGIALDGVNPTPDAILQGTYEYASPYWLYAKRGQARHGRAPAIDAAVDRVIAYSLTEAAIGPKGTLSTLGLIPLPTDDRAAQRAAFSARPSAYGVSPIIDWLATTSSAAWDLVRVAVGQPSASDESTDIDFTKLMDIAGYKVQEFQTTVGILPGAGMTFGINREMSEADQDYLERKLAQDGHLRPGALPSLQRKIVRSVLDVSETNGYEISQVEIELLPLPSFKLVVSPTDAPISQETTSILRAIERLNDRLSEMVQ